MGGKMNIDLKVRYYTDKHDWLCFTHAVRAAVSGVKVETDIDDFGSEYYLGTTRCVQCDFEKENEDEDLTLRLQNQEALLREIDRRRQLGKEVIQVCKGRNGLSFYVTPTEGDPVVQFHFRCCDSWVPANVYDAHKGMVHEIPWCNCREPNLDKNVCKVNGVEMAITLSKVFTKRFEDGQKK